MEEQGAATQEIARGVDEAAQKTSQAGGSIEAATNAAGETGHTTGQVAEAATGLSTQAETLAPGVDTFLSSLHQAGNESAQKKAA